MARRTKTAQQAFPMDLKLVIAENLKQLMRDARDERLRSDRGLEELTGVSYKTVQRLRLPKDDGSPPTLSNLYRLAHAFDTEVWELLRPRHRRPLISGNEQRTPENQPPAAHSAERTRGRKANK